MTEHCCFHCHLSIYGAPLFYATVDNVQQPMCCPGCKAVTETILASGMSRYYQQRTDTGQQGQTVNASLTEKALIYDRPDIQQSFVETLPQEQLQANLLIDGITCAACVWLLESHLSSLPGVVRVNINLSTHEAEIIWQQNVIKLSQLMTEVIRIGYTAHPWHADHQDALLKNENRQFIRKLAVAGIGTMQVMMYAIALYSGAISQDMTDTFRDLMRYISAIVTTPVIFYAAAPFFKAAVRAIKIKHPSMDVPVSLAIGGAYLASLWATFNGHGEVYFDSVCMFTFFLLTGRYLELKARHSSARAARTLSHLLPTSCLKRQGHEWQRIPLQDLKVDDEIRILPGDSIPSDGLIIAGHSSIDEALLTGEYMPISKTIGDTVSGGSINKGNAIEVRITHIGKQTKIANIMALLQRARQDKPAISLIADKVAAHFVSAVLFMALAVYLYWYYTAPTDAFWITLSVLVATCPCALSLATPTALTAATGCLHRAGLLVTRGHVLEGLNDINHIVFDKTGTLTQGELTLTAVKPVNQQTDETTQWKKIAAALEAHSEHPIATAFAIHLDQQITATQVLNHTGQGLEGVINNTTYRLGKPTFALAGLTITPPDSGQWLLLSAQAQSHQWQPLCWFKTTDTLRPEAKQVLEQLTKADYKITLLSGDREPVVAQMAADLGIQHWQSESQPDEKLLFIQRCQQQGDRLLMVGDGVNDVPVLAGADISMAMGQASDLACTQADAVLLSMDLRRIPNAFQIAQKTRRIIRQNTIWALAYNLTALPLACAGWVAPWMAAIGMTLSSVLVVTNACRLNTTKTQPSYNKKPPVYHPSRG